LTIDKGTIYVWTEGQGGNTYTPRWNMITRALKQRSMVKNMLYIHSWLTKRKVTSTTHWGKGLAKVEKKSIKN